MVPALITALLVAMLLFAIDGLLARSGRRHGPGTPIPSVKAPGDTIAEALRGAIADGLLVPYFEPQIDLASGRIAGFQVHPHTDGPISGLPSTAVIPVLAERHGLMGELSLSLLRRAFAAAHDWDPGLTLAIGIAPQSLRDPWLAQKIIKALVEAGFPASRLEIMLDDCTMGDDLPLAPSIVASLRNQGVRITLAGSVTSSPDRPTIAFDRVAVNAGPAVGTAALAQMLSAIETANLPVTACGVTTPATAALLGRLSCARVQGQHFGPPAGAAETRRLLAEKRLLCQAPAAPRVPFASTTPMKHRGETAREASRPR